VTASEEVYIVFLFADLSGYTAMTEAHGGERAAVAVARYVDLARENLEPGSQIVQRVGDEVLIVANTIEAAVKTAVRLRAAIECEPLFPSVRAGIHAGRVIATSEGYFGPALNLAARVADYARGGQILCTPPIAEVAGQLPDTNVVPLRPIRFKNVAEAVPLFAIEGARSCEEAMVIDPVCRMQVGVDSAPARLPFGGVTFRFCSFACAQKFAVSPDNYRE
jgi:adenylate cyclase